MTSVRLNEMPDYGDGWADAELGHTKNHGPRRGDAREAYRMGYDDAVTWRAEQDGGTIA